MVRVSGSGAFVDVLPLTACAWGKAEEIALGIALGWTPGGAKEYWKVPKWGRSEELA